MKKPDDEYRRLRLRIFVIVWLSYAGFYFTRKAFSVAKIGMLGDATLGITEHMLANIDALYLAAYAAGQFFFGVLADKIGTRRVVLAGLLSSALAGALMGFSSAVALMGVLMFIQGLAQSTGWAPLSKNLGYWFARHERGRIFGFWSTSYAFGSMLASPFAGFVALHVFHSWRWAFFAPAAVVIAVWALFLVFQRNRPEDVGLPAIEEYMGEPVAVIKPGECAADEPDGSWKVVAEIYSNPVVLLLGAVYFLIKPARYTLLLWGPLIVNQRLGTDMFNSSVIAVSFDAAGIIGAVTAGYISDRLFGARRMPVCVISLVLLSLVFALFALFDTARVGGGAGVMVALFVLSGLLHYGPDSIIGGTAAVDFGSKKGASSAAGLVNGLGSAGAVLGGWLPGLFVAKGDLFFIYAGTMLLAALLLLPLWNREPATECRTL